MGNSSCNCCGSTMEKVRRSRVEVEAPHSGVKLAIVFEHAATNIRLCPSCIGAVLRLALRGLYEAHPEAKPRRGRKPKGHKPDCACQKCHPPSIKPIEEENQEDEDADE